MAVYDYTPTATGFSRGRIRSAIAQVFAAFATWNDARVTRNSLSKLSGRELDDIGLCRGDIDDIADRITR